MGMKLYNMKLLTINYGNELVTIVDNQNVSIDTNVSGTDLTNQECIDFLQLSFDSEYHDVANVFFNETITTSIAGEYHVTLNYDFSGSGGAGVIENGHIAVTLT